MPFTKDTVKLIGKDVEDALQAVAEKYGATVKRGRGTYDSTGFDLKVKFTTTTADGLTREQKDFKQYASLYGLEADDLGMDVLMNGEHFTITGLLMNRPKKCIEITRVDGKVFITTKETAKMIISVAKARKGGEKS